MAYKKKTWTEKLHDKKEFPKILEFDPNFPCGKALSKWGAEPGDPVVLTAPIEVDEVIRQVPKGKIITIFEICDVLAKRHQAKFCCSLTTGIFMNIVAHAAEEAKERGESVITPYWRALKTNGVLNPKYPGGADAQKQLLEKEGLIVLAKGKNYFVKDFKANLYQDLE
jgi:alkylated DNA nucleotide flippase Atl1